MRPALSIALAFAPVWLAGPSLAETLYVPTLEVFQTDGGLLRVPIEGAENGLPLAACEERVAHWTEENAEKVEAAVADLQAKGQSGAVTAVCALR